jgi:hypothetical protein
MGTWPPRTAFLISGCLNSEPLEWILMSSLPPLVFFTSSANFAMFCV